MIPLVLHSSMQPAIVPEELYLMLDTEARIDLLRRDEVLKRSYVLSLDHVYFQVPFFQISYPFT